MSSNTSPDEVTGNALSWVITHSQDSKTRELAIRAISMLKSEKTLKQLVARAPGIFPQVIQSFTSCFSMHSRGGQLGFNKKVNVDGASLHGQALGILVNRILRSSSRTDSEYLATWGIDDDTIVAVEKRFQLYVITCSSFMILIRESSGWPTILRAKMGALWGS